MEKRTKKLLRLSLCFGWLAVTLLCFGNYRALHQPSNRPRSSTTSTGTFLDANRRPPNNGRTEYGYWTVDPLPTRVVLPQPWHSKTAHFWHHPGVDPLAILRAIWKGHSGASTIAMQVARMQHPRPRTLWAKAIEATTALALTLRYGHTAVLAQYLRLVPYGNGSHGIAHAARIYLRQTRRRPQLGRNRPALRHSASPRTASTHATPDGLAKKPSDAANACSTNSPHNGVITPRRTAPRPRSARRPCNCPRPRYTRPDAIHAILHLARA